MCESNQTTTTTTTKRATPMIMMESSHCACDDNDNNDNENVAGISFSTNKATNDNDNNNNNDDDDGYYCNKNYNILIEFAYKHLDFHMAELESVLNMNNIYIINNNNHNHHKINDNNNDNSNDTSNSNDNRNNNNNKNHDHCNNQKHKKKMKKKMKKRAEFVRLLPLPKNMDAWFNDDDNNTAGAGGCNTVGSGRGVGEEQDEKMEEVEKKDKKNDQEDDDGDKNNDNDEDDNNDIDRMNVEHGGLAMVTITKNNNAMTANKGSNKIHQLGRRKRRRQQQLKKRPPIVRARRPFVILSLSPNSKYIPIRHEYDDSSEEKEEEETNDDDGQQQQQSFNSWKRRIRRRRRSTTSNDIASIILDRCTLVRSVMELWGCGCTLEECAKSTKQFIQTAEHSQRQHQQQSISSSTTSSSHRSPPGINGSWGSRCYNRVSSSSSSSWKITIHTLGSKYNRDEHELMRQQFHFLNFNGPVRMNNPDNEYIIIREVQLDNKGGPIYPRYDNNKNLIVVNDRKPPLACYFGRILYIMNNNDNNKHNDVDDDDMMKQQTTTTTTKRNNINHSHCIPMDKKKGRKEQLKDRGGITRYNLKRLPYLGPTSMDSELSLIMTNLGQVDMGRIAFDPFCGTCTILLMCSLRGAYCIGTDIDIRVLRGHGVGQTNTTKQKTQQQQQQKQQENTTTTSNVFANFDMFGLVRPEIIRSDNSMYDRHYIRSYEKPMYDAIICDPPYGIRAGARKTGSKATATTTKKKKRKQKQEEEQQEEDQEEDDEEHNDPDTTTTTATSISKSSIPDHYRDDHIAQTKPYSVDDVMKDLLDVAARTLTMNGRLVYIIPSLLVSDDDDDHHDDDNENNEKDVTNINNENNENNSHDDGTRCRFVAGLAISNDKDNSNHNHNNENDYIPQHECLRLIYSCYQPLLSADYGRRIIVMEKIKHYDIKQRNQYMSNIWKYGIRSSNRLVNIRQKLIHISYTRKKKTTTNDDDIERVHIRKQKRKYIRQQRKKLKQQRKQQQQKQEESQEQSQEEQTRTSGTIVIVK